MSALCITQTKVTAPTFSDIKVCVCVCVAWVNFLS